MNIVINGSAKIVEHEQLNLVINELGYQNSVVVTAVNGTFVSVETRIKITLKDGDKIEVLAPMQGG